MVVCMLYQVAQCMQHLPLPPSRWNLLACLLSPVGSLFKFCCGKFTLHIIRDILGFLRQNDWPLSGGTCYCSYAPVCTASLLKSTQCMSKLHSTMWWSRLILQCVASLRWSCQHRLWVWPQLDSFRNFSQGRAEYVCVHCTKRLWKGWQSNSKNNDNLHTHSISALQKQRQQHSAMK